MRKERNKIEKLSKIIKDIINEQDFCFDPYEMRAVETGLKLLSAYEDTGLKPKEIRSLQTQLYSVVPCCECGGSVIEFSIPNDIWNFVMRPDGKETDKEYLCLNCWYEALRNKFAEFKRREKAAVEMQHRMDLAYAEANNAIYFSDSSDYLTALYEVCIQLVPEVDEGKIGTEYIET